MLELFHGANIELLYDFLFIFVLTPIQCFYPFVLEGLLGSQSPLRLGDQFFNQVFCVVGNLIPLLTIEIEDSFLDHLQNFLVVVTIERRIAAQQDIQNAPSRPHIAGKVIVASQNLW